MQKYKTGLSIDIAVQIIPFAVALLGIFDKQTFIFYAIGLFLIGIWNFIGNIWHHQIKANFKYRAFRAKFFVAALVYIAVLILVFGVFENSLKRIIDDPVWIFVFAPVFQVVYFILTIKELNNLSKYDYESIEKQ